MRIRVLLLLVVVLLNGPASAQWIQQKKEDPFDGKHLYIALTASANYGLGVRCEAGTGRPEIMLITPEKVEGGVVQLMNLASPKLLVIVDDLPAKYLEATLSTSEDDKVIVLSDDASIDGLTADLMAARRRIAVAVEAAGEKFHKIQFGVSGTKKAVGSVANGCKSSD
jgi:hypothetical protein